MILLHIVAVHDFENDIKSMLKKAGINVFSYTSVTGFKTGDESARAENWFALNSHENDSIMFIVFTEEENADNLKIAAILFNASQETSNSIHSYRSETMRFV
jgi:aryl-alcohol dehydrogenase-like predicted oxidoreductase